MRAGAAVSGVATITCVHGLIDNRYEIIRALGSGGMAEVYLARDETLGRQVALKGLGRRYAGNPDFVQRFEREAKSAAALSHPNVVIVHDWGKAENGSYYLIMEYLPGGSRKDLIEKEGRLPASRAVRFALQVAEALQEAHGQGIVHRDIKPANVMLTNKGDAKVGDFGIAWSAFSEKITTTDQIAPFTPAYGSPEQKKGRHVDVKSDLYSLGLVLHETLTGENPSHRADRGISGDIPEELGEIILHLLSENPEQHPGARELIQNLERVNFDSGAKPRTVEVPDLVGRELSRARKTLAGAGLELGKCYKAAHETFAKGRIFKQEPSTGIKTKRGSVVDVRVSSGNPIVETPRTVKVPDLYRKDIIEARSLLASMGLELREWDRHHRTFESWKSTVCDQRPGAGASVKPGSSVGVLVGAGGWRDGPTRRYHTFLDDVLPTLAFLLILGIGAIGAGYEAVFIGLQVLGIVELSRPPWWAWLLAPGMLVVGIVWGVRSGEIEGGGWLFLAIPLGIGILWAIF